MSLLVLTPSKLKLTNRNNANMKKTMLASSRILHTTRKKQKKHHLHSRSCYQGILDFDFNDYSIIENCLIN